MGFELNPNVRYILHKPRPLLEHSLYIKKHSFASGLGFTYPRGIPSTIIPKYIKNPSYKLNYRFNFYELPNNQSKIDNRTHREEREFISQWFDTSDDFFVEDDERNNYSYYDEDVNYINDNIVEPRELTTEEIYEDYDRDESTWMELPWTQYHGDGTKTEIKTHRKIPFNEWYHGIFLNKPKGVPYYITDNFTPLKYLRSIHNIERSYLDFTLHGHRHEDTLEREEMTGKGWSAPIVIFDTETTSLRPNRQTVNVAALKVRYNFKTSKWAIIDTYERYYLPDFNKGEFSKYNYNDAVDIYNQSEAVKISGLSTWQLNNERNKGVYRGVPDTFTTKEQENLIRWMTGDKSETPIIVGNNIKFDALSINSAFVKYMGFNPTYLDLMDMAQATPMLKTNLATYRMRTGRGGLSVPDLYERLVGPNYIEKHYAAQDVFDEFDILKALTNRIYNEHTTAEGWNRLHNLLRPDSPFTSRFVQYEWNTFPIANQYDGYDDARKLLSDIGFSPVDTDDIIKKIQKGIYRPGTLGNMMSKKLGINITSAKLNMIANNLHKMTPEQRKEYREYINEKKYKQSAGDISVVETQVFDNDELVNAGFVNEDFVNYDYAKTNKTDTGDIEYSRIENLGFSITPYYVSKEEKEALRKNNKDIVIEGLKRARKKAGTSSYYLEQGLKYEKSNPYFNMYQKTTKQLLESTVKEMNKYPKYRNKLAVAYVKGKGWTVVSDDPNIQAMLDNTTGGGGDLSNPYIEDTIKRRTKAGYSRIFESDEHRIRRAIEMDINRKWQELRMDAKTLKDYGDMSQADYDLFKGELDKIGTDFYGRHHFINKFKKVQDWLDVQNEFNEDSIINAQRRIAFVRSLKHDYEQGLIDNDTFSSISERLINRKMSLGDAQFAYDSYKNNRDMQKFVDEYVSQGKPAWTDAYNLFTKSQDDADAIAAQEVNDELNKIHVRKGAVDRMDYLVNHGKLSRGTADALIKQFDAAVASGKDLGKAFDDLTKSTDKAVVAQQKAYRVWENMSKAYDFNNVYQTGYAQINGTLGSMSGVLPNFIMNPLRRGSAAFINGMEIDRAKYNYYARLASTGRNILASASGLIGLATGGPIGGAVGTSIGGFAGEAVTDLYNNWLWRREKKYTEIGQTMQNSFNTVGFLKSISGLDVAFSALTKTVKWATLGFIGMVTKGLHSMQSLGNPITQLSGVNYANYQVYGRMDRMFGFSNGTINSSIENFALQQKRMYTYGQMDIDRVVAASMLGVFGSVYANGGDPKTNYEATVNKIASGGITDTKISWAAMIDKTLPQILQIMKDMNAKTLGDVYKQSGVSFNELTDDERIKMRRVSFGYRTALSNISTSWQRMGTSMWEGGLNKIFDRVGRWIETLAQNAGIWIGKINPLIDAFDKLFEAFKTGNSNEIQSAMEGLKKQFVDIFSKLQEPVAKLISGISVAMMAGIQALMPAITGMLKTLIGEIGQFHFDKDAFTSNMTKGTTLPFLTYGPTQGQFQYTGKNEAERKEFNELVRSLRAEGKSTEQIKKEIDSPTASYGGYELSKWRGKYVSTSDFNPAEIVGQVQSAVDSTSAQIQNGELFNKFFNAMMDAFKSFTVNLNLKDENGNERSVRSGESKDVANWSAKVAQY